MASNGAMIRMKAVEHRENLSQIVAWRKVSFQSQNFMFTPGSLRLQSRFEDCPSQLRQN